MIGKILRDTLKYRRKQPCTRDEYPHILKFIPETIFQILIDLDYIRIRKYFLYFLMEIP